MLSVALRQSFPGFALDLAFQAPAGVTALFGRSGSGKTTVVNAVAGLSRPQAGRILLGGRVLVDTDTRIFVPPHRRRIGYVFQESRLFPHLTVRQNLLFGRWFAPRGAGAGADFGRIVDLLGIGPLLDRRPGALSGGEKARVALGRAILSRPALLLLDEPLAALDDARKTEILPYLERLRDETRLPMLYVSHSLAEVARLANTIVVLDAGRILQAGTADVLLADPALAPALGLRAAGAVLTVTVAGQEADGLTRLDAQAGPLWLPRVQAPVGARLRLRLPAQDVMLALTRPEGISALNVLPVVVDEVRLGEGPGVLVRLMAGQEPILARITRRSAEALGLQPGQQIFAVLKAVSIAPSSIGEAQPIG